jgi:hypothetical protein
MPSANLGDMCTCGGAADTIVLASIEVFIGGKPDARMDYFRKKYQDVLVLFTFLIIGIALRVNLNLLIVCELDEI